MSIKISLLVYRIGVGAYHGAIRAAALLGRSKAKEWVAGREQREAAVKIAALHEAGRKILWMHVASLGEFEQGAPVLEEIRKQRPECAVVLTFFSPSGYEKRKHTKLAEVVAYLPPDGPENAREWIALLRPAAAVFVKYEFWYYHLRALRRAAVPTFLIAASFRPDQPFFRRWGGLWREMLSYYRHIFVQSNSDARLLDRANVSVTGDPRVDRTRALAEQPFDDERLKAFTAGGPTLFVGSAWEEDVARLEKSIDALPSDWKIVVAPHELDETQLNDWGERLSAGRYSREELDNRVLLLDVIGVLSRAYRYGDLAYVGGAFRTGLHNTLEPMAYGLPVIFGPRHHKFPEAAAAIARGGAFSFSTAGELRDLFARLSDPRQRAVASDAQLELLGDSAGSASITSGKLLELIPDP